MAEKEKKSDTPITDNTPPVNITLADFVKEAEGDDLLKSMFVHFTIKLEGPDVTTTKEAFQDLFNAFKNIPADQLI